MSLVGSPAWRHRSVLVTGGAGFIGSHLVDRLVNEGARVRVLDNLTGGTLDNLTGSRGAIDLRIDDLRDAAAVDDAIRGCEVVFHLGANASVPVSVDDRAYDFTTNTQGTFHVADAAVRHGVHRVIYASTAAVYGPPESTPVGELHPLNPISPYGASKLAGERLLYGYARTYGFELAIVRIFNTYGPRQRRYVAYDLMMKLARDPRSLEVLGTGEQRRSYCYVSDTTAALMLAARVPAAPPVVYNVSADSTVSIRELTGMILRTLRLRDTNDRYGLPSWTGDIDVLSGDSTRLRALGWRPRVGLSTGLRRLAAYYNLAPARRPDTVRSEALIDAVTAS
jgi:UDP-glucose 4-epimerase